MHDNPDPLATGPAPTEPLGASLPSDVSRRIGAYHIKSVIASGGMGTVYEAVQENPRRTVALKVMKRGIASRAALRRFEYEAQILARMRHPHVAQIFEAGTHKDGADDVPYFAMEYVPHALPITSYVTEKKLDLRQRLELFAGVCEAVHHGHQKGIIHRDLKPANILVDSNGQAKVIDFGVARGTDSDLVITTLQTDIGQLVGTLRYMSPEQCVADPHDIDVRSDVYSLGVVLYELLCGTMPYDLSGSNIFESTRIIREKPAKRPSSENRTLRGDVETILLKALEKDRARRYQSAQELAQDFRRYLDGELITARPPTVAYQLRLFARRNKGLVAATLGVAATIVIAAIVSMYLFLDARAARDEAALESKNANFVAQAARTDLWESVWELVNLNAKFRRLQRTITPDGLARSPVELPVLDDPETWLKRLLPEIFWEEGDPHGDPTTTRFPSDEVDKALESLDQWNRSGQDQTDRGRALIDWIQTNHHRFEQVVDKISQEDWNFAFQPKKQAPFLADMLLTYLSEVRLLGKCLIIVAWAHVLNGDISGAATTLRAVDKVANDVGDGGTLISLLVEVAVKKMMLKHTRQMMTVIAAQGDRPLPIEDVVRGVRHLGDFSATLALEALAVRQFVSQACKYRSPNGPLLFDSTLLSVRAGDELVGENVYSKLDGPIDYDGTLAAIENEARGYLTATSDEVDLLDSQSAFTSLKPPSNPVVQALYPDLSRALFLFYDLRADIDGTILSAAICEYRVAQGRWPTSLDEVLADVAPRMARTEYLGSPFLYGVIDDWPLLYYVDDDGHDNGGRPIRDASGERDQVLLAPPGWSARFEPPAEPSASGNSKP